MRLLGPMRAEWLRSLVLGCVLLGCGGESTPRTPIEELIAAARADDPAALRTLCVPGVRDGDARRVCGSRADHAEDWAVVRSWFERARIVKVSEIHGDEVVIEVEMGPDARKIPMTVVLQDGRWFLSRF